MKSFTVNVIFSIPIATVDCNLNAGKRQLDDANNQWQDPSFDLHFAALVKLPKSTP